MLKDGGMRDAKIFKFFDFRKIQDSFPAELLYLLELTTQRYIFSVLDTAHLN